MQQGLLDIFLRLGSEWVLHLLLGLSVLSIAVGLERVVHFVRRRGDPDKVRVALIGALGAGDLEAARTALRGDRSYPAEIALAGLDAMQRGAAATEEMMHAATFAVRAKMERGLGFLGTLGNNAPFIGLFGTVLGIIRAFRDLSVASADSSTAVMAGIAEALVATAVGLLVALPAVAAFNGFQRLVRARLSSGEALAHVLLAHAKEKAV